MTQCNVPEEEDSHLFITVILPTCCVFMRRIMYVLQNNEEMETCTCLEHLYFKNQLFWELHYGIF
jgi:hypothetical protein